MGGGGPGIGCATSFSSGKMNVRKGRCWREVGITCPTAVGPPEVI